LFIIKGQFSVSRVYVKDLLAEGTEKGSAELRPHKYSVVRADQSYCGEIEVGITFTLKVTFQFEIAHISCYANNSKECKLEFYEKNMLVSCYAQWKI